MSKKCTGCGRIEGTPLGFNKLGEPFLACCPDNNYVEITAVQWLLENAIGIDWYTFYNAKRDLFEQAKELEEKLAFKHFKAGQDSMKEGGKSFEQYYNETYKPTI